MITREMQLPELVIPIPGGMWWENPSRQWKPGQGGGVDEITLRHIFTITTFSYWVQKHQVSRFWDDPKFGKHWRTAIKGAGPQPKKTVLWSISLLPWTLTLQSRKEGLSSASARFHPHGLSPEVSPAHPSIVKKPRLMGPHSNMREQRQTKQVCSNPRDKELGCLGGSVG